MVDTATDQRLQVTIVGAGICGLLCASALREFADVTVLESAPALGEIGAAVHLQPNAHRIIKKYGGDLMRHGALCCTSYQEWRAFDNKITITAPCDPVADAGIEWALCHRVSVQRELMRMATTLDGPGTPATVLLDSPVVSCDVETATVTTRDGRTFHADVLIAADGIKSVVRPAVVGKAFHSTPSGHSAYRALIPAHKINDNPRLSKIGLMNNRITIVNGGDRRIVCYPTQYGQLLNFVCPLPDSELNEISEEKWSAKGNPEALVKSYSSFDPMWQELLAQTGECGLWQLRDQDPLNDWVRGRAILVGDAAHSMLPHQGQGASQAIEDGEALGSFLRGVSSADVPAALKRVFEVRYRRATYVQQLSRRNGLGDMRRKNLAKLGMEDQADAPLNPDQYRDFCWNYFGAERWEKEHPDWIGGSAE